MREGCQTDESGASRVGEILPARSLPIQLESPMFTSPTARDHKMAECFSPTSYRPSFLPTFTLDRPAETRVRGLLIKRHASRFAHRFTSRHYSLVDTGLIATMLVLAWPRDAVTARRRGGEPRGIARPRDVDDIAQYLRIA
ncbi:hypothetical protein ALC53_04313 [Atta colombica]|uniref:Uncharacterized protein n=1 Tax=Atta colombica TaxID=520822 RepID=A0A151I574_9HYME|nr:hypothetical protein ALC53_04313 [Atta colombica]